MKKILIIATIASAFSWLLIGTYLLWPSTPVSILGAPAASYTRDLVPDRDSERYVGTTTPSTNAYAGVITDQLCLTGDSCRTTWPGSTNNPDLILKLVGGTTYLAASTTANAWYFDQGFVSNASSTINGVLTVTSTITGSNLSGTNTGNVTLAGTPNYLTLSGQEITLTKLDISDDTNATGGAGLTLTANDFAVGNGTCITVNANDVAVTSNCTDSATVDSIEGASLLRSDATDSYSSGTLTFDAGTSLISNASTTFTQGLLVSNLPFQASSTALFGSGISVTGGTVTFPAGFGGRSTTINGTALDVDAELYTKMFTFAVATSTFSTTTMVSQHKLAVAGTIVRVSCSTNQGTTSVQLDERTEGNEKAAGTNILNNNLGCGSGEDVNAATSFTNAGIAADGIINLQFTGASSTKPTQIFIHVEYTVDD